MITATPEAAEKIKEILTEEDGTYLRVFVQGGGCSGFQYGLTVEQEKTDADQVFESKGVKIIVDPVSICYLKGAEVRFIDNDSGGGFTVHNPNAVSTCGCGQSFKVN